MLRLTTPSNKSQDGYCLKVKEREAGIGIARRWARLIRETVKEYGRESVGDGNKRFIREYKSGRLWGRRERHGEGPGWQQRGVESADRS
jgi:hypothetical protein